MDLMITRGRSGNPKEVRRYPGVLGVFLRDRTGFKAWRFFQVALMASVSAAKSSTPSSASRTWVMLTRLG
jgi:hypothetical protein